MHEGFGRLLKIVKDNQDVATGLLLPLLFKLSREKEPTVQMELLRGLTQFAVIKENIPTILNTLNSLTSGALRPLSLDLYLRLWKQEVRFMRECERHWLISFNKIYRIEPIRFCTNYSTTRRKRTKLPMN